MTSLFESANMASANTTSRATSVLSHCILVHTRLSSAMTFALRLQSLNYFLIRALLYLYVNLLIFEFPCSTLQTSGLHTQNVYQLGPPSTHLQDKWYKLPSFRKKECYAVQTSIVIRNGISLPSENLIKRVMQIHEKIVEAMDLDVNIKLYEWNNPFHTDQAGFISKQGKHEQKTLGKNIAQRLISLYGSEDIGDVTFLTSSQAAPKQSAQSFYSGFFDGVHGGEYGDEVDIFDIEVDDKLLGYIKRCPPTKEKDAKEMNEFTKFLSSQHMMNIKMKIAKQLSISENILTNENIWDVYLICTYEQANAETSAWCSLFDDEDVDVLDYLGDLKLFHEMGENKSWPHGCFMLTEIFTAMEEAIDEIEGLNINENEDGYNVGLFSFTEAETVANFMLVMGLFNDSSHPKADNFDIHKQRDNQGKELLPFSANVLLILYECEPEDYRTDETSYLVRMFVNEKETLIPGCSDFVCPFEQVTKYYQVLTDNCNTDKLCGRQLKRDEL